MSLSSELGALQWIALRTRPDLAWSVSRVPRAPKDEEETATAWVRVRHILQDLYKTWSYKLVFRPNNEEERLQMKIHADASLAPTGGKSHEGSCVFHGQNLISWRSSRQHLTSLSTCESELVALSSGVTYGIPLLLTMRELQAAAVSLEASTDNTAALQHVKLGAESPYRTRHISMRGVHLHDHVEHGLLSCSYVPTTINAADAMTKGLSTLILRRLLPLLCLHVG